MINIDLKKIKGIVFDMDGTMIDNNSFHIKAWEAFTKKYNLPFDLDTYRTKFSGGTNTNALKILFGSDLADKLLEEYAYEKESLYRNIYKPHIKEVSGLKNLIKKIKSHKLAVAVATSAPFENVEFVLKELELDENSFDVVTDISQVINGKPHPEIYLKTAAALKIDPKFLLAFEDSPKGIESAKSAGLTVCALLTSHTKEELSMADQTIKDFTEVSLG